MRWNAGNLCVADIDWAKWRQFQPGIKDRPLFSHLLAELEGGGDGLDSHGILVALAALPPEKRIDRLCSGIAAIVAESLHLRADTLDFHQPFNEMGIDSLLGLELQSAMSVKLGVEVSLMELMKSKGIASLASDLLAKMRISDTNEAEPDTGGETASETNTGKPGARDAVRSFGNNTN
jgi:acyl carrier protein